MCQPEQNLNNELLELREWTEQRMNRQMMLHDRMVVYYDRMMTKCNVYEEELERTRTENARFKFTAQCLMDKIKELTSTIVKKPSINSLNNDEVNDSNKDEYCNKDNDHDKDNDNDTDSIATYLEVCSKTLIDEVGAYKERVENATIELDNLKDQLTRSVEKQVCLKECVDELTALSKTERMKRDQDELELRTTVDRLTAELVEMQQEMSRLQAVEADISVKLMHRESEQGELDEVVRSDNARLQAQLGKSAIEEAALQSKLYDLELELSKRTEASKMQQEPYQVSFDSESIDGSSTSLIMYQCNLSRTSDDQVACFPDLGRGDDQLIPCLLSSTKSCAVAENAQLPCSQSTNDVCQPSCLDSTNDDHQPSCSTSTAVQGSAETASEPSQDELNNRRLAELIKQYASQDDDDCPDVQGSVETASEPSQDEWNNRRLAELLKQYASQDDDDCPDVQGSVETASEPSQDEWNNRRLAELLKQYASQDDDDCPTVQGSAETATEPSQDEWKNHSLAELIKQYES